MSTSLRRLNTAHARTVTARVARTCCAGLLVLVASCGGQSPSALSPTGPGARRVAGLWWLLFGISAVVSVIVTLLLLWAVTRRRGPGVVPRPGSGTRFVVAMGVIVPAIVLIFVYAVGLRDMRALEAPHGADSLVVEVTGHQWWWEVRYPASGAVTANEIHIPAGRPVLLRLRTADVNHSFWVPQLTVKTDMIAGRTTQMWLQADRPGTYRGQCAEYCGLQHGRMAFHVVADPPAAFASWLADQAGPAAEPREALAVRGRQVIQAASCASCHTVRGTSADGRRGPDLTHLASRRYLGAGTVPNNPGHLGGWIADSQAVKPGNQMPPQPLPPEDLRSLIAYLGTLR